MQGMEDDDNDDDGHIGLFFQAASARPPTLLL